MQQQRVLGGRYVLAGLLGRGGMAEVHLARDQRLDRLVAVKVMRPDMAVDPSFRARFQREAHSAASLNDPSIVAVFDSGEDTAAGLPLPYLVMEYVHGATLLDLLRDERGVAPRRALELTRGVLDGLVHAHAHGIVHRDIKPANVMLADDGQVKVMDFGIARLLEQGGADLTRTAMVIGTAECLSPEQARGERVDARADLYSVGCLLYELLTGRPPFLGDTPLEVAWQHLREQPEPPSARVPALDHACDALVLRAMAKDREQRFACAADMRAEVEQLLQRVTAGPRPVLAAMAPLDGAPRPTERDSGAAARRGSGGRRRGRRVPLGTAVVAVAALVVGVAAYEAGGSPTPASVAGSATGAHQLLTPDLTGASLPGARAELRAHGLHLARVLVGGCPEPAAAAHRVCQQDPVPDSPVGSGAAVTLRLAG
ncbi:protein kinase [Streptacidiphilus sp. P02-A3a]|uniref:protein kinase domain-containing protein n=1 Tax=Streptacidiphilus sp. P02-A3a TaxID=2704468 RepID=UPI001CDBF72C|nr:protein kinase [Streptacidiphilus sp. P02-A3a]